MVMVLLVKNANPAMKAIGQQARGMATEKQILMRIGATSNIAKITKSMKMVSAAKKRGAENRLMAARPFLEWLDNLGIGKSRVIDKEGLVPLEEFEGHKNTLLVVSSDRGLCGGINSGISKQVRKQVAGLNKSNYQLFIVGEKGRSQLRRDMASQIRGNVTESFAMPANFTLSSAVAEAVLSGAEENEKVHVIFNQYVSAITYHPKIRSLGVALDAEEFASYELEPDNKDEILGDLKEFELASAVYQAMVENATSEESSRMAAMENATNNASELISSLTLSYNKARQARITTELIEIISGASSLDG